YLPAEIVAALDLRKVELVKDSFVDEELAEHLSDLIYRVGLKGGGKTFVYVLFEHKSVAEEYVAFQVLRYEVRVWEQELRQGAKRLSPILPLVLYHGQGKWNVDERFAALVEFGGCEELRKYVPEFRYHLCDLAKLEDEEIAGEPILQVGLAALKYVFRRELGAKLAGILEPLNEAAERGRMEYLKTVVRYLSQAGKHLKAAQMKAALDEVFAAGEGGLMPTIAETWIKEGEQRGLQQGVQQGLQQGLLQGVQQRLEREKELVTRQLEQRFGKLAPTIQRQIKHLSAEQVEALLLAVFAFKAKADLANWLKQHSLKRPK
ncbi:MAG: Rpn family recombination-promoting nuclease/putative transposase, partial [Acidobacteria bacterium]|nr:Rpn family recombination-promoting nuclease/putative transposase [Acidobacteriota bacterium]